MLESTVTKNGSDMTSKTGSPSDPFASIISSMMVQKGEINEEIEVIRTEMAEMRTGAADPSDIATNNEIFTAKRDRLDKIRKRLQEIETALKKHEDGEFGVCNGCGENISVKRLEAIVFKPSLLCVDCQDAVEREEKKGGRRA